jgi:hypothetical protein
MAKPQVNELEKDGRDYLRPRLQHLKGVLNGHVIPARSTGYERTRSERINFGEDLSLDATIYYPGGYKGSKTLVAKIGGPALIDEHWYGVASSHGIERPLGVNGLFSNGLAVSLRAADSGEWADLDITSASYEPRGPFISSSEHYVMARQASRMAGGDEGLYAEYNDIFMDASQRLDTTPEALAGFLLEIPEHMLLMTKGARLGVGDGITITDTTPEDS